MTQGIFATKTGIITQEVEVPKELPERYVRVKTEYSVASVGTELSIARRIRESDSDRQARLGYSAAGTVVEAGPESGFAVGQKVAVYGAPYTWHCGELLVPRTLVAPVGEGVDMASAATVGLGAIALHALHSANIEIGQHVAVIGLGALGIILARLAAAAGCFVYASDPKPARHALVREPRIVPCTPGELADVVNEATGGQGADIVFLMVGTADSGLLEDSVKLCRLRGTLSVVSDADGKLPREALFSKEVRLIVPQAGGPGRYQPGYEREATDYPYSEVRWTEGRNMRDYIRFLEQKFLFVDDLLPEPVDLSEAPTVFADLEARRTSNLTAVFRY